MSSKRAKLRGVAALPPLPELPHFVSRADGYRMDMLRLLFQMPDEELLQVIKKNAQQPTPTLRLTAGGAR